jgi:hypothetical protein
MAIFNPQYFTNPVGSLNTAFGIPTCILNFGVAALGLIDSNVLVTINEAAEEGKAAARKAIGGIVNDLFNEMGILQYDTATGKLALFSSSSKFGMDLGFLNKLSAITGYLSEIESLINQGEDIYNQVKNCIGDLQSWLESTGPSNITGTGGVGGGSTSSYAQNYRTASLAVARARVEEAQAFIDQCDALIENVGTVLAERQAQEDTPEEEEGPIFRLVYGPPVTKQGLFILSEDGLYYDSQKRTYNGKPIPSASDIGVVVESEKWKMDHAPNLGGKGTIVSVQDLNKYVDTIFDIEIIDNNSQLQAFYEADHFLNVLEGQKDRLVYDVSSQIGELIASGYDSDAALVVNQRQQLFSVIASFENKANKRKKQIEVAVKSADLFGTDATFEVGNVPLNDFSFLSSINLDITLAQQERLVFEAGDVEDIVLPIRPIFVRNFGTKSKSLNSPFVVPPFGAGSIVYDPSISSTTVPTISLTDSIVTNGLFAVYNYLKALGKDPDSTVFDSINCASNRTLNSCQLIGANNTLFASGLGIPRFDGLTKLHTGPNLKYKLQGVGTACRLPSTDDFDNFLYNRTGASFDCWIHMPGFGTSSNYYENEQQGTISPNARDAGWADFNYYKIILANENTGGDLGNLDPSNMYQAGGSETVRGFLMGFTRDPVIYSRDQVIYPGSNTDPGEHAGDPGDGGINVGDTTSGTCFFLAPTMSLNTSTIEFVPKQQNCADEGFCKMTIPTSSTVNGKSFNDLSSGFYHLNVTFDSSSDKCNVYLDGELMQTSAMSEVFGIKTGQVPRIPTFIRPNDSEVSSFYYSSGSVDQGQTSIFDNGPNNNTFFTPWMLGGGWTDGYPIDLSTSSGGFMGKRHGWTSGLNGHLGSVKFYSRPLTIKEVQKNYEAQKGFFKNIVT